MLIAAEDLKAMNSDFEGVDNYELTRKLEAIELAIRAYTNNNFQVRPVRALCYSKGKALIASDIFLNFKVGNTVQISKEPMNNGLYLVSKVENNVLTVDKDLLESAHNIVTLVRYPADIVMGAINVLKWDCFDRYKLGIASETISRHSVSYQQYDGSNTINGYPSALFGFCTPYIKART